MAVRISEHILAWPFTKPYLLIIPFSDLNYPIAPYAISSPEWVERMANSQGYDMPDNIPTARQPRYINITADGLLDLPPQLRNIINDFEQLYENTRYKRLHPHSRPRSLGEAADGRGNPVYDRLQRVISPAATFQQNKGSQGEQFTAVKKEHKHCHSVDLGELRRFIGARKVNTQSMEMTKVPGTVVQRYQHRFSVDLGHLREFISLREMKICNKGQSLI